MKRSIKFPLVLFLCNFFTLVISNGLIAEAIKPPTLEEIVYAHHDVITDYALSLPGGPTYEALLPLLPPVRWVFSEFRHYPVVLSAPTATVKGRIASNGSGLNPLANNPPTWKEAGRELRILIGNGVERFGHDLKRLGEGRWLDGYKPVWVVDYISQSGTKWQLQVFAAVEPDLAAVGALCFEIKNIAGSPEKIQLKLAERNNAEQLFENEKLKPPAKTAKKTANPAALSTNPAHWLKSDQVLKPDPENPLVYQAELKPGEAVSAILLTKPTSVVFNPEFESRRANCISIWEKLQEKGLKWHFPEPLIENAWRAHLIAIGMIISGKSPDYSAINAYDHLYMTEGSDMLRGLAFWGQNDHLKRVADAQFAFVRTDTRTAVAGMKLTLARDLAEITGDPSYFINQEIKWAQSRDFILNNIDAEHGLPPADRYAGDLGGAVLNLRSSSVCWKGLRDIAFAMKSNGRLDEANAIEQKAETLHKYIIKALETSEKRYNDPDFVPIGFFGKDQPVKRVPDTQLSSYYNLIMGNVLDCGILGPDREAKVIRYLENRAGFSMGLPRTRPFWPNSPYFGQDGVAPLYGLRYSWTRLRLDQPDHALVTLYGWLAHGMSRQGFVHGEGVRYTGGDADGRYFHLPPNSCSSANWLTLLRFLLVAEWDTNFDATYDTLRLLDATPPAWMEDQKRIEFSNAPSRFGKVSVKVESRVEKGQIDVALDLPAKRPQETTIRFRLPKPYKANFLQIGDRKIMPDDRGRFSLQGLPKQSSGVLYVMKNQ